MLAKDERGLVFVLTLPIAAVLVFAFWHVARVGELILERERAQDAADATAFESALLHARGMNALALLKSLEPSEPALVRELAPKVASVVPVLATVAAVEDNTPFYERTLMSASYALLGSDTDTQLMHDGQRPWAFARGVSVARLSAESSLPVTRGLAMWPEAENGNAMLQVWAWSEPKVGKPAVAQAEYYLACSGDWGECEPWALRSLSWTARMRRVWSPELELRDPIREALARADGQLRTQLPNAPKLHTLFDLLADSARWRH